MDVDPGLGPFDYIVLHSVYSRHDSQARGKLLTACRDLLAPQGVAYVEYPTYPGWRVHDTIRQLIAYDAPGDRARAARRDGANGF